MKLIGWQTNEQSATYFLVRIQTFMIFICVILSRLNDDAYTLILSHYCKTINKNDYYTEGSDWRGNLGQGFV